jgi:hypothetical protein
MFIVFWQRIALVFSLVFVFFFALALIRLLISKNCYYLPCPETTHRHEREFGAKLSDDVEEELMKGEADSADQEAKVGWEDEDPATGDYHSSIYSLYATSYL